MQPKEIFEKAGQALLKGDFSKGEKLLREVLNALPNHTSSLSNLGMICLQQGRFNEAEDFLTRALEKDDTQLSIHQNLVVVYVVKGDLTEAEKHMKIIKDRFVAGDALLARQLATFFATCANQYIQSCLVEPAEQLCLQALKLDQLYSAAWALAGSVTAQAGKFDVAADYFLSATNLEPDNAQFRFNLARVQASLFQYDKAVESLEMTLKSDPDHKQARTKLADLLIKVGRTEEARREVESLLQTASNSAKPNLWLMMAQVEFSQGSNDNALALIREARPGVLVEDGDLKTFHHIVSLPETCLEEGWECRTSNAKIMRHMSNDKIDYIPFLARIEGGGVLGGANLPTTDDGRVFTQCLIHNTETLLSNKTVDKYDTLVTAYGDNLLAIVQGSRHVDGAAVLIGGNDNFGHWMLNHFGRLFFLEEHEDVQKLPLLIWDDLSLSKLETLRLAGYGEDRLIPFSRKEHITMDTLWVPSMPFFGCSCGTLCWTKKIMPFIRRRLGVRDKPTGDRKRLYIPRAQARWRRLRNEDELIAELAPFGFEVIDPGSLSLQEQIDVAANAEMIIGPFGAGMNLLIFAPIDCTVIELKNGPSPMDINPFLCGAIGQTHHSIMANWIDMKNPALLDADFTVDIPSLISLVESH